MAITKKHAIYRVIVRDIVAKKHKAISVYDTNKSFDVFVNDLKEFISGE
jgi:hypothetical protein